MRSTVAVAALIAVQSLLVAILGSTREQSLPQLTTAQRERSFRLRVECSHWKGRVRSDRDLIQQQLGRLDGICTEEQFDAIRTPMTFREVFRLLGPSRFNRIDSDFMQWTCVDARSFQMNGVNEFDALIHDFESLRDQQVSGVRSMSMYRDEGIYREHFGIPARKPDEVETAIRQFGPKGRPEWR